MKRIGILIIVLACWAGVQAQNLKFGKPASEELNMTIYDKDPEAAAVVLCDLTTVSYTMDFYNFLVDYEVKRRIKVLKDDGKDYANISISYIDNPGEQYAQESIADFRATVYNVENGKTVKTKIGGERLFKERIDEDYMLAKVALPQVKAGSVIEYEYRLHSNVFYHIYDWNVQTGIPVAYAHYRLEIPAIFIYNVETTGMQQLETAVSQGSLAFKSNSNSLTGPDKCNTNVYLCTARNLPALKKDDFVWNVDDYATKVTAELQRINNPRGGFRDVRKKWEQVDQTLLDHPDFGSHLHKHSKYREELAASGIAEMGDLSQKVAATWRFLMQRLSWNGEYDLKIRPASEVVKKGSGTNADLNMMLINMLGDVGVKAEPVVLSTRRHGRLPKTYPSLNKLNTFIVGIPDGGKWLYLDASSADGYLNVLSPNLYAEQARIIQKGAPGQWVNLQKVGEARTQVSIQATLSPDGELKGEQTVLYQGNAAAEERHAFRTATDSAAFVAAKAERNGYEITALQMTGHRQFGPSVRENIAFTRRADATADHIYFSPFTGTPITSNPFVEQERRLPVEFPCRQNYNMTIRLTLPDGWLIEEMPKSTRVTTADRSITGQLLFEAADEHTLTIHYQFRLSELVYTSDNYDTLRQLFDLFASRSKDVVVIKRQS